MATAVEVTETLTTPMRNGPCAIYRGRVCLPAEGTWRLASDPGADVPQIYFAPPPEARRAAQGRRMRAVEQERMVQQARHPLSMLYPPCLEYARSHGNVGPAAVTNLEPRRYRHVMDGLNRAPWPTGRDPDGDDSATAVEGPFYFLVPEAAFRLDSRSRLVPASNAAALAVELRPFVDDGKHWVLYTDGRCERAVVDDAFARKHSIAIRPVRKPENPQTPPPTQFDYSVTALCSKPDAKIPLTLRNPFSGDRVSLVWDLSTARPGDRTALLEDFENTRVRTWGAYAEFCDSPVLAAWMDRRQPAGPREARRPEATSVTAILGGRAAVRETLQLQALTDARPGSSAPAVPVDSLPGVAVKSLPFDEMLRGRSPEVPPLASLAPPDRFFLYVAKPAALLGFLTDGAEFLSRIGTLAASSAIEYNLKERYLARLGMDEKWLKAFLASGAVTDMALIAPDLFFVDGTEVTVVSRLSQVALLAPILRLIGVPVPGAKPEKRAIADGRDVWWALRDSLLFVSTRESELDAVLRLHAAGGRDSLGLSSEFRYMQTQLPVGKETRLYAYFSDAFIRHVVGPKAKIGQYRRACARADMEKTLGAALLAKADGVPDFASLDALIERSALPQRLRGALAMDSDLTVRSSAYGTLAAMRTLSETTVDAVTPQEAQAYKNYLENYSRFWRRFFDPIAMRLDDGSDGGLELTTFILPLIENSIYNGLREVIVTAEAGQPLRQARITPRPSLSLSLNLRDEAWRKVAEGLSDLLARHGRVAPAAVDDLGPGLTLAVHDSDTVLTFGSGDVFGLFGANAVGMGRTEMIMIPLAVSVLTRPCTLVVETRNPERTRAFLRQAAESGWTPRSGRDRHVSVDFHQLADRDAWVCVVGLERIARLRFGIELRDSFLVLRNLPWSSADQVAASGHASLNGARLEAAPAACIRQSASLHAAAMDSARAGALQAMGYLYPLLLSGVCAPDTAADAHARLFGFRPVHPEGGRWGWEAREVTSTRFGTIAQQRQPAYREGESDFGLFNRTDQLAIGMQFEQSGLRTRVSWRAR